jgi:hypothetical protein
MWPRPSWRKRFEYRTDHGRIRSNVGTDVLIPTDRGLESFRAGQYRFGHPFITELAEGTLPLDKFRFFLEQDDFYLEEYSRCLALGGGEVTERA